MNFFLLKMQIGICKYYDGHLLGKTCMGIVVSNNCKFTYYLRNEWSINNSPKVCIFVYIFSLSYTYLMLILFYNVLTIFDIDLVKTLHKLKICTYRSCFIRYYSSTMHKKTSFFKKVSNLINYYIIDTYVLI